MESVGSENGMMIMLDEAIIQYMGENFFRISLSSYPGNSGAPILYFKNGKYYIIGVVSAGFFLAPGISLRSAMITDLNFLNNEYENAPQ
jgi:V8-like Glu-specific endopeptidase